QVTLIHVVETLVGVPLEAEAPLVASSQPVDARGNEANAVQRYAAYQLGLDIGNWPAPRVRVCEGDAAEALAEVSQDFDCLVLGHHHTSFLRRIAGRTTDETLCECCACPLFVVPYNRQRCKTP
ncbi:MAG: universal stress protein, partial [Planctomycetota bacterium]